jgi:hypothetical protein
MKVKEEKEEEELKRIVEEKAKTIAAALKLKEEKVIRYI